MINADRSTDICGCGSRNGIRGEQLTMDSGNKKPTARLKRKNLPPAPEPSRQEHIDLENGVRSAAAIQIAKYLYRRDREREQGERSL